MMNEGFTLIELIVVMAIIAVLVLLAAPRFIGYTKDANVTAMMQDTKVLSDAVEMYHVDTGDWPKLDKIDNHGVGGVGELYKLNESELGDSIKNIKGDYGDYGIAVDGKYEGQVFHLEGVMDRFDVRQYGSNLKNLEEKYSEYLAVDSDFEMVNGYWRYIGDSKIVLMPHTINGMDVTSYRVMFRRTDVEKVISTNKNITDMNFMFRDGMSEEIDVSELETSNVTSMHGMFEDSNATHINLDNFNTNRVTSMHAMFLGAKAIDLNFNTFNTSNVIDTARMFEGSTATELDLSNFDTRNIKSSYNMFYNSKATTGYARTQKDAEKLNSSSNKPIELDFTVKNDDI